MKTRRVTSVAQVGTDRLIEIQFSDGQYRLFLEFYAGGNIVLTNSDLQVLVLLRNVPESADQVPLRPGLQYSVAGHQNIDGLPPLTKERVKDGLRKMLLKANETSATAQKKKVKQKPGDALRKALADAVNEFSPVLIEHALRDIGVDLTTPPAKVLEDDSVFDNVMLALEKARKIFDSLGITGIRKGYIVAKSVKPGLKLPFKDDEDAEARQDHLVKYEEFHPFKLRIASDSDDTSILEYESFNKAIDEFFSSVESQKLESRLTEKEEGAKRKLEHARQDHERRLGGLQQVQELNVRKAQAIEANLQIVQEAIAAVNSLIAQGMDWQNVARLIEVEKTRQNPVAEIMHLPLKLYENTITLVLNEGSEDEADFEGDETDSDVSDEGEKPSNSTAAAATSSVDRGLKIDIDLALSPWSNARQYYDQKKHAAVKEQKTLQASGKALKSQEKKIEADLKKGLQQEKDLMRPQRSSYWFEKFLYFISSEGYLVIGGKDAQQSDILYQKHFKKGDVFVHADLQGAIPLIVKNRSRSSTDPIPPSTLSQAGALAVATSVAWDSKALMPAWWVYGDQVSKMSSHGDLLQAGTFSTTGEKNFLPPAQLLLGFGVFFKISEDSKARHQKFRVKDTSEDLASTQTVKANKSSETESQVAESDPIILDSNEAQVTNSDEDANAELIAESDGSENDVGNDHDEEQSHAFNSLQPNGPQHGQGSISGDVYDNAPEEESKEGHSPDIDPNEDDVNGIAPTVDAVELGENVNEHPSSHEDEEADPSDGDDLRSSHNEADEDSPNHAPSSVSEVASASKGSADPQTGSKLEPSQQQQQQIRGKHGKRQKQKQKYAHQDEEDRALAMRLLGSAAVHERAKDAAAEKEAKQKQLADQKERRRKQHAQVTEKSRAAEEARKREFEQDGEDEEEPEAEGSGVDLEAFVGAPLPGDEILDALVVCGPWEAIGPRCRWKAKLQPGATKKGKAVKEILSTWNAGAAVPEAKKRGGSGAGNEVMIEEEKLRKREAELIKAFRDVEVIGIVPISKMRVLIGGGEKSGAGGKGGGRSSKGNRGKGSKKK